MRGNAHFICSTICGLTASVFFQGEADLLDPVCLILASSIGGLLPDIDLPDSTAGKVIKPISRDINKLFGHRTITHSGLWLIPLLILYYFYPNSFLLGYIVGFFSHLLADTMTYGGVPWLFPFSRKRYRFTKIKSGQHDGILSAFTVLLFVVICVGVRYAIDSNIFSFLTI